MDKTTEKIAEWDLLTTNLARTQERQYEVAVLPLGAVEPHNRHLPYGQDVFHTVEITRRSCAAAWEKCPSVVCLPALPYGVDCNLMDYPLTISVSQTILDAMIAEIIASLQQHGIRKIVLVNGHGGNDFTPLVRQIQCDLDVHVFLCDWWKVGHNQYDDIFDNRDDHAGEMETSIALELYDSLVELERAGDGKVRPFRFEALQQGWVRTSRDFGKTTDHCAAGTPGNPAPEKGRKYLDLVCTRIADFLVQLAQTPIDDCFPLQNDGA